MEISYSDMRTLMPHTYLNDEIINFYMKYLFFIKDLFNMNFWTKKSNNKFTYLILIFL